MTVNDLKPCPFCGGEAVLIVQPIDLKYKNFFVKCVICGVHTQKYLISKLAAHNWNRRVDDSD